LLNEGLAHRVTLASELASAGPSTALSGAELGRLLGISRAAVHKHMQQLQALGFAVTPVPRAGYRLTHAFSDLVVPEAVLPFLFDFASGQEDPLRPPSVGLPYRYLAECPSTNALLKEMAAASPAGTVVVTDEQTGGRGRLGRGWVSQAGRDLTFSVLVRPALAPARAHLLSLAAAIAVAETLEGLPGLQAAVGIKWPNDVLLGDRKVCGILLEGAMDADSLQWAIMGIGLNVNSEPAAFTAGLDPERRSEWVGRPLPTSLRAELDRDVPRAPLFAGLLVALGRRLAEVEDSAATVLAAVRRRDLLKGRPVQVFAGPSLDHQVTSGEAGGIGDEGQLLVRTPDGEVVPVFAGDVTLRSPAPVNHLARPG
jgi:BirA family transcriptional regulator, biotin operon repressor / biotin---[acetyl-CoA-carboxylase] ligase